GAAVGALARHRLLPQRELAVLVAVAGPEGLAAVRAFLHDLALAALRTGDARRLRRRRLGPDLADVLAFRVAGAAVEGAEAAALERHRPAAHLAGRDLFLRAAVGRRGGLGRRLLDVAGVLALRIVTAGDERAEASEAHQQPRAALGTGLVERDALALDVGHLHARRLQVPRELLIEFRHRPLPPEPALLDLVELLLQGGRVTFVQDVVEALLEHAVDQPAQGRGTEAPLHPVDVVAIGEHGEDGGVGRGPADAVLLQRLDQGGLAVLRRRLSEVLLRKELHQLERLALAQRRQHGAFAVGLLARVLVRGLAVDRQEAGALQHLARGAEHVAAVLDVHLGHVEDGGLHLRGDEAVPDQLVELPLVLFEETPDRLRRQVEAGGADRLVGVLRSGLRRIDVRLCGQGVRAVGGGDVLAPAHERLLGHAGRVGAHVGDETGRAAVADLAPFVEPLGEGHGALDGEAVPPRRFLLQAAGDERRRRTLPRLLALHLGDDEAAAFQIADDARRLLAVVDFGLAAFDAVQAGVEDRRLGGLEIGAEQPVFLGAEGLDRGLPVADHLEGHGLH